MKEYDKLKEMIDNSKYIVFFGGAGVSTESGIKDFRSKNGLYNQKYDEYNPEYLLSHDCLVNNSKVFYDYYRKNMNFLNALPNITHNVLAKLEQNGKLAAIITQNIDSLHQKAGSKNVLELHGTIYENYCMKCHKKYASDIIFNSNGIPRCNCGGMIRPNVILYGEMLPDIYLDACDYISQADLLIVAGTSLTVEPASGMIKLFKGKNLVIINKDKTAYDKFANLVIHNSLGDVFRYLKDKQI